MSKSKSSTIAPGFLPGSPADAPINVKDRLTGRPWNWGFLSTSKIAHDFAKAVSILPEAKLYAVGSTKLEKANEFGEKYNIPKRYGNYEDLAKDSDIDVIYISTPHNFHYENIKLCLNNGRNVLCEKPITINAAQAKELAELAKSKNIFLLEGMWTRFMPFARKVKQLINENKIGRVKLVNCDMGFNPFEDEEIRKRLLEKNQAGGATLDIGVYGVSFGSFIYGGASGNRATKISATAQIAETGVDELSCISTVYGDRQLSVSTASLGIEPPGDAWITGEKGRIRVHGPHFNAAEKVSVYGADPESEPQVLEFPLGSQEGYNYPGGPNFVWECIEVMKCLSTNQKQHDDMPLSESIAVLETLDEARKQMGVVYEKEPFEVSAPVRLMNTVTDSVTKAFGNLTHSDKDKDKPKA